jgi:hypothetical protein
VIDPHAAARHLEAPATRVAGLPTIRPMWATVLLPQGRWDEAIRLGERAVEEDPLEVGPG